MAELQLWRVKVTHVKEISSGWGRYTLIQPRPEKPQATSRERWEAVRRQLQEVVA